ncbi:hypothetical protein BV898_17397 [Hypsibius exemplaris]|uniref:Uncharacterized protein n=1 Tax=Hypsibius exemplaris TaxID=2072580 RepID=A0A9X6RMR7_HYPEX|nr:hypothetical protein BV898_17397 [Hypsibius exemplaris]
MVYSIPAPVLPRAVSSDVLPYVSFDPTKVVTSTVPLNSGADGFLFTKPYKTALARLCLGLRCTFTVLVAGSLDTSLIVGESKDNRGLISRHFASKTLSVLTVVYD